MERVAHVLLDLFFRVFPLAAPDDEECRNYRNDIDDSFFFHGCVV